MANTTAAEVFGRRCQYHYEKNDYIGKGTFGMVYKANVVERGDFVGETTVAVKVIHLNQNSLNSQLTSDPEKWQKLRKRLQRLLELQHDNLVPYHKITLTNTTGIVELMMDYYCGGDLASFLTRTKDQHGIFKQRRAIRFSQQIAHGLMFLHENNIIPGDIKPGNILIKNLESPNESLQIGDLDDLVQMHREAGTCSLDITHLRGSCRYMSPEMLMRFAQLPGPMPGRKTDIWSFGCLILELANTALRLPDKWFSTTGRVVPMTSTMSEPQFMSMVLNGALPFVDQRVPARWAQCIQWCLRAVSNERITADRLYRELLDAEKTVPNGQSMDYIVLHIDQKIRPDLANAVENSVVCVPGDGLSIHFLDTDYTTSATFRKWSLPSGLSNQNFVDNFVALGNEVVCQIRRSDGLVDTVVWNISRQTCRLLNIHNVYPRVIFRCPIGLEKTVYFWTKNNELAMMDTSDGSVLVISMPPNAEQIRKICGGVLIKDRIFYVVASSADVSSVLSLKSLIGFNIMTYNWEDFGNLPDFDQRTNFAMVELQGKIYLLSGSEDGKAVMGSCSRFDVATRSWKSLGDLLRKRYNHCAFMFNGSIHVFGGKSYLEDEHPSLVNVISSYWRDDYTPLPIETYDAEKNVWKEVSYVALDRDGQTPIRHQAFSNYRRTISIPLQST